MAGDLYCHGCGARFRRYAGADLHCRPECGEKHAAKIDEIKKTLASSGFEVHPEAENVYMQEGIALTVEQVLHEGIDRVMERHRQARDHKGQ